MKLLATIIGLWIGSMLVSVLSALFGTLWLMLFLNFTNQNIVDVPTYGYADLFLPVLFGSLVLGSVGSLLNGARNDKSED